MQSINVALDSKMSSIGIFIDRRAVETFLREWKAESGLKNSKKCLYNLKSTALTVYCPSPGYLIGRGGLLFEKYKGKLLAIGVKSVEIVEVEDVVI